MQGQVTGPVVILCAGQAKSCPEKAIAEQKRSSGVPPSMEKSGKEFLLTYKLSFAKQIEKELPLFPFKNWL